MGPGAGVKFFFVRLQGDELNLEWIATSLPTVTLRNDGLGRCLR